MLPCSQMQLTLYNPSKKLSVAASVHALRDLLLLVAERPLAATQKGSIYNRLHTHIYIHCYALYTDTRNQPYCIYA